jgi:protein required for attachment to host cells
MVEAGMKPVLTMVLVASERDARLFVNAGVGAGLAERAQLLAEAYEDADQGFDDAPGVMMGGPGGARHGLPARESAREARRAAFAAHVVEALERAVRDEACTRLVVSAPPKMLGHLRATLPPLLAGMVVADMPKDLARIPARDLPRHFAEVAAF